MRAATTVRTVTQVGMLGVAVLGCATAGGESRRERVPTLRTPLTAVALEPSIGPAPGRTSDLLTAAELASEPGLGSIWLHDALTRLRPWFLSSRDVRASAIASGVSPAVLVDGTYWGGLEALRGITVSAVAEVQYVRPLDALHRFGPAYQAGVILVRLRR